MGIPSALTINTNLDMVKTPGFYFCNGAENENRPDDSGSFSLLVEKTGAWEGKGVKQTYTGFSSGITYTRVFQGYDETIWEEWKQLSTATPPQKYSLPLADGWVRVNAAEYWKTQEGIVIVTFRVAPENGVAIDTSTKIIATLPEGFRPVGYMPHISAVTMKNGEKGNDAQAWINETGNIYAQAVTPIPETSGGSPANWGGFAGTFIFVSNS